MSSAVLPDRVPVEGLVVRTWRESDVDAMAEAIGASLPQLRRYLPWAAHEPLSGPERRGLIAQWESARLAGGDVVYGVFEVGRAVGGIGAHHRIAADGLEIGYWLRPDAQGHGVATRAVRALTRTLLDLPGITHVEIAADEANTASRAVAARCGYRLVRRERRERAAPAETGWHVVYRIEDFSVAGQ